MSTSFKIFFFLLLTAIVLDFGRQLFDDNNTTPDRLISYAEAEIDKTAETIFNDGFISTIENDTFAPEVLNRINLIDQELRERKTSVELYAIDSIIYWSGELTRDQFCKTFKKEDYKARICIELFDQNGRLHDDIYERAGLYNTLLLNTSHEGTFASKIEIAAPHYGRRLNNFILLCYGLALALLMVSLLKHQQYKLFSIPIIIRGLSLSIPSWERRLSNSDFFHILFDSTAYSSLDLTQDVMLFFGILVAFTSHHFDKSNLLKSKSFNAIHSVFLSLLIISHIRLVQLFVYSSSFDLSISDLSKLNWRGAITILSLLLVQFGIFVYAVGFVQALKKLKNRNAIYQSLIIATVLSTVLAYVLKLDLNIALICVFFIAFFILIDLFIDVKQKSLTWIIWWAIFFGVYLSSLLFNYDIRKEVNNRIAFIETLYSNEELTVSSEESEVLSAASSSLKELLTLTTEEIYDINDITAFLREKHQQKSLLIDIIKENKNSAGLWENPELFKTINDSISIDPIKGVLWQTASRGDSLQIRTGLQLDRLSRDTFPLAIVFNNKVYDYNLGLNTRSIGAIKSCKDKSCSIDSEIYLKHNYEDKLLITRKSFDGLIKPIALFALLFSVIITLILIIGFANSYYRILPEDWPLKFASIESLNSKIQVALIFVILLSFILIAILTSSFLKSYIDKRNKAFLDDKVESLSLDLKSKMALADTYPGGLAVLNNYKSVTEIIHDVRLDIMDLEDKKGDLFFPYAYFKKQISPQAYSLQINAKDWVSYLPISFNERPVAFAKIKHNNQELQKLNVIDFLGSIFNVYVFLFLLASVIAIIIARSITRPLSILNQKLTQLRLGKRNELISWDREDEIGELINNYNKMVDQLEDSAQILAKTERDSAWREMAKQVAHEIKNPLTPMKMYIQHLEKAVKQQPQNAVEISKKISTTLLEQVNNLTQIADSFSNFAELPQSKNEKIDLNRVVEVVHNLFRKRDDMDIRLSNPIDPVYVFADKNQLIRILNNLVKNATEAIPHDRRGEIDLHLYEKDDKALIKVSDNGTGVPIEMYTKIFQPKFTTKDSGSGLGLAIALNMIESMNGRLYFESQSNVGTDFFIELDIIRQNYQDNKERITLD